MKVLPNHLYLMVKDCHHGSTNLTSTVSGDSVNLTLNSTITGLTSVQTETLTNVSGNLLVNN